MDSGGKFRHEYKYAVNEMQLNLIEGRIRGLMSRDPHAGVGGIYNIRSLYFDDRYNSCFYDNINGTDPREKFRIRIYNRSDDGIKLELKQKIRGKCRKLSCSLTRQQYDTILKEGYVPVGDNTPPLLNKFGAMVLTSGLKPVNIVEYERTPWVYNDGNVRVTFDRNIRSSGETGSLFDPDIPTRNVMPAGQHILEVKWDEFLPGFIYKSVMIYGLRQTAYSKYALCRKFFI